MTAQCRADCGEPLDQVLIDPDGTGIHPTCHALATPILPALAGILARHQAGQDRSLQRAIGPSQVGDPCDRALGYRLHRVPQVRDEGLKWGPLLGTWAHAGIAEALEQENKRLGRHRYLIEQRVEIDPPLLPGGTIDCFDQDTGEVIDWKLVSASAVKRYRKDGPGSVYRTQGHLYGLGAERAGWQPRSVRIVFLPKQLIPGGSILDGYEWQEPYRRDVAEEALRRLQRVQYLTGAVAVEKEPRNWALIPASTDPGDCTYCPWRRDEWLTRATADDTGCAGVAA